MSYINPVPGSRVTSEYGPRGSGFHLGIDLGASQGTLVKAAKAGTVNWVQRWNGWQKTGNQSYGNVVRILHADGKTTLYAHLHTIAVSHGQKVSQGQTLGTVGNTGNSFGAHLHLEVATASPLKRHNPRDYINFNGVKNIPKNNIKRLVCIDPGHGGGDPGATNKNTGHREKDIVLDVALMVRDLLEANGQPAYVMTRSTDKRLVEESNQDLYARARLSNNAKADAYVSIHMNAFNGTAKGIETFSWNGANTPGLARAIHNRVVKQCPHSVDRGLKTANYAVLRETYAIAALIEMAFVDNSNDVKYVVDNKEAYATAIAQGICDYLGVPFDSKAPKKEVKSNDDELYKSSIMGKPVIDAKTLAAYAKSINAHPRINCSLEELANMFIEEGVKEGVRGDIAWCQSLKETGYFKYGGQVLPAQNNYAGIGAVNNSPTGFGAWFETPREGVRAQIQHLKAYASKDNLAQANVDPRFHLVSRGIAPTWVDLSGKWAVPGYDKNKYDNLQDAIEFRNDYGSTILAIYQNILDGYNPTTLNTYPAMDNVADGWATEAIEWAIEESLLVGDPNGNLRLHDNVTRQELMAILQRFDQKMKS